MPLLEKKLIKIGVGKILTIQWGAQTLANLCFGLPLAIIIILNFPEMPIGLAAGVYLGAYLIIYMPLYALLPFFWTKGINRVLNKHFNNQSSEEELTKILGKILNLPLYISVLVFFFSFTAFLSSLFLYFLKLPFEIPSDFIGIFGIGLGLMVSLAHAVFNYDFLDLGLRPTKEYLSGLVSKSSPKEIKARKFPIFVKVLIVCLSIAVLISTFFLVIFYSQLSDIIPLQELNKAIRLVGFSTIFILFYIFLISFFFAKEISFPMNKIVDWSKKISKEKGEKATGIRTNDEVSEVAFFLDQMTGKLKESQSVLEIQVKARTRELEEERKGLEIRVKERTKELQEKLDELERFRKLTTGRELKMIELKKEIERLKQKKGKIQ